MKKNVQVRHMNGTLKSRKLKVKEDFLTCPADDEDEMYRAGIFEFNITKMEEYIKRVAGEDICLESVMVSALDAFDVDDEYVEKADVSRPVIMAEIAPLQYSLIDGRHRATKARKMGLEKVMAYKIPMEHHIRFLTERRGYEVYVEYWNDKLKALARRKVGAVLAPC